VARRQRRREEEEQWDGGGIVGIVLVILGVLGWLCKVAIPMAENEGRGNHWS